MFLPVGSESPFHIWCGPAVRVSSQRECWRRSACSPTPAANRWCRSVPAKRGTASTKLDRSIAATDRSVHDAALLRSRKSGFLPNGTWPIGGQAGEFLAARRNIVKKSGEGGFEAGQDG